MKKISLSNGEFALVDDADFKMLNKYRWRKTKEGYITTTTTPRKLMHRMIIGLDGFNSVCDYINGNRLDHRRNNLRVCTRQQLSRKRAVKSQNPTGYKGVYKRKKRFPHYSDGYQARIFFNGERITVGTYKTAAEAAEAYNKAALTFFGEYARLNDVKRLGKKQHTAKP